MAFGKKLAYIVKVNDVRDIPGADRIQLASVMDYTVVIKKNEYKPGDFGLYVEVGSVLPDGLSTEDKVTYAAMKDGSFFKDNGVISAEEMDAAKAELQKHSKYPYFEFLRDKDFCIRSMKLNKFGVISQGILFKPEDIGLGKVKLGQDFTKELCITEKVEDEEEAGLNGKKDNFIVRYMMRYAWFRAWRKSHRVAEAWDPSFPGKSDEENVQKIYSKMYAEHADEEWVATEKLEGQNISIYSENVKGWFGKTTKRVGVCSRTRELNPDGTGANFWKTVKRLGLDEKVKNIPGEWWCRGEHVGPNIQNNIYKLPNTDVIFFDFYRKVEYTDKLNKKAWKWEKLNFEESKKFAETWDLKFVPILDEHYKLPTSTVNDKGVTLSGADIMLQQSDKNTVFGNNLKHKREGFVLRLKNDYNVSFKVKNPNYSI